MQKRVWDFAVRITHLSYPLMLLGLWITAENGWMGIHVALGISLCGILVFRILWGFFGSNTARFSTFIAGPAHSVKFAIRSLRQPSGYSYFGHNPLGAWSVVALIAAMSFQVVTGLLSIDTDGIFSGALARFVSFKIGREMADLHELGFNLVVTLICLHLAAILFYLIVKRDNLILPMITGKRRDSDLPPDAHFRPAAPSALIGCVIIAAGIAGYLAWLQFG